MKEMLWKKNKIRIRTLFSLLFVTGPRTRTAKLNAMLSIVLQAVSFHFVVGDLWIINWLYEQHVNRTELLLYWVYFFFSLASLRSCVEKNCSWPPNETLMRTHKIQIRLINLHYKILMRYLLDWIWICNSSYFAQNWTEAFCLFALLGVIVWYVQCSCQCLCNMASLFTYCVFLADFFFFHLCFVYLFFFLLLTFALYFLNKEVVLAEAQYVCCIDTSFVLLKVIQIDHSRNSRCSHVWRFFPIQRENWLYWATGECHIVSVIWDLVLLFGWKVLLVKIEFKKCLLLSR